MSYDEAPITGNVSLEGRAATALREVLAASYALVKNIRTSNAALPWDVSESVRALVATIDRAEHVLLERIDGARIMPAKERRR